MKTKQQQETLRYFKEHADQWKDKGLLPDQREVNVIRQRNNFVLDVIKNRGLTTATLDVGCGTGDLVYDIARMGIDSTGVDFANEMIDIARTRAEQASLGRAHFHCSSFFDFDLTALRYDTISANGFIEYISLPELDLFLDLAYQALNPGGSLVLGSRNRLFNIFSVNAFTLKEINCGNSTLLLKEAIALAAGTSLPELAQLETAPIQNDNAEYGHTGIDVSIRHQFTPAQLAKLLKVHGFTVEQIYPIHIHGVPPTFKNKQPEIHTGISTLLQEYADQDLSLVACASSFMVHAKSGTGV